MNTLLLLKNRAIIFLAISSLMYSLFSCSEKEKQFQRPNIVLIFSDELQFEDISSYGGKINTPNIDKLAGEGLKFTNAYAVAPMCTPSRFALLIGKYPGRCKHPKFIEKNPRNDPYCIGWDTFIDSSLTTLPRFLSENGYTTGMVGKWHLGEEGHWDSFFEGNELWNPDTMEQMLTKHQSQVQDKIAKDAGFDKVHSAVYTNHDLFQVKSLHYHNFPWLTKGAVDFLENNANKEKPFFLYLAPTGIHGPHHALGLERDFKNTPEGRVEDVLNYQLDIDKLIDDVKGMSSPESMRYAGMAFLDHQLGVIMTKLKELGIDENTVVIFLPDHNTEPAKATCYEKGLKIPMIIRWPSTISGGMVTQSRVQTIDIFPTILEIAGLDPKDIEELDGLSFAGVFNNPKEASKNYIFAESGLTRSVNDGRFKYIAFRYPEQVIEAMKMGQINYAPNYLNKRWQGHSIIAAKYYPSYFSADQLFDLENDPFEQHNLAYDPNYAKTLKELQSVLAQHLTTFDHPFNLSDTTFMLTEAYLELAKMTKNLNVEDINWYVRDWGNIIWPPSIE